MKNEISKGISYFIFHSTIGFGCPKARHFKTASSLTAWITILEKLATVAGIGVWGVSFTISDSIPSPWIVLAVTQKL